MAFGKRIRSREHKTSAVHRKKDSSGSVNTSGSGSRLNSPYQSNGHPSSSGHGSSKSQNSLGVVPRTPSQPTNDTTTSLAQSASSSQHGWYEEASASQKAEDRMKAENFGIWPGDRPPLQFPDKLNADTAARLHTAFSSLIDRMELQGRMKFNSRPRPLNLCDRARRPTIASDSHEDEQTPSLIGDEACNDDESVPVCESPSLYDLGNSPTIRHLDDPFSVTVQDSTMMQSQVPESPSTPIAPATDAPMAYHPHEILQIVQQALLQTQAAAHAISVEAVQAAVMNEMKQRSRLHGSLSGATVRHPNNASSADGETGQPRTAHPARAYYEGRSSPTPLALPPSALPSASNWPSAMDDTMQPVIDQDPFDQPASDAYAEEILPSTPVGRARGMSASSKTHFESALKRPSKPYNASPFAVGANHDHSTLARRRTPLD
ncbi:hypothetical protein KEM52_001055 [Ascosphaera acerosa]|nr:hypothetical protein KEM52_001055 [Ascosphaera acerosa]